MKFSQFFQSVSVGFSLGILFLATGCKTVDSTAAAKFATSVTTLKSQADDALNAAATLTRDAGATYVSTRPTLDEADFAETPSSDVIADWDNTLSAIEAYSLNLAALSSPDAANNFAAAATNLFNQFNQTASALNNSSFALSSRGASLAAGFTEVATLILRAEGQKSARKIAAATDPQITNILNLLAAEIGADHTSPCLRTTIYRVWGVQAAALTAPFLTATNQPAKKVIAQQYATILAERAAEDQVLLGLRRSLLALSDAHHALAQGNETSVQSALTIIGTELQHSRDLFNQFSAEARK